jgi:hypothetical protein
MASVSVAEDTLAVTLTIRAGAARAADRIRRSLGR